MDHVELNLHALSLNRAGRLMFLAPVVLVPGACLFFFLAWQSAEPETQLLLVYGFVALGGALFCFKPFFRLVELVKAELMFDAKNATNLHLSITANGLTVKGRFFETVYAWQGVDQIAKTRNHLFVYLSKRAATIVPARAFKQREQFQAFASELCRYHELAAHDYGTN